MPKHPFVEALLQRLAGMPSLSEGTPQQGRDLIAAGRGALGTGPNMHRTLDLVLPSRGGSLQARLHVPVADPVGIVVYLHGGGWALGAIDDFDTLGRAIAERSGCAVLLPDYRLSPEHPFPAALHDTEDAVRYLTAHGRDLIGRPLPIVLAGDSAGANLGTVAARTLRGTADIVLQVLIYPVTDCDFDRPSYIEHGEGLPLTRRDMEWFFGLYAPPDRWSDPRISPLRSDDLAGLSPALVITAEYDVLESEGRAYAEKLSAAGLKVDFRCIPGVTHGFIRLHNLFDVADAQVSAIADAVAQACMSPV